MSNLGEFLIEMTQGKRLRSGVAECPRISPTFDKATAWCPLYRKPSVFADSNILYSSKYTGFLFSRIWIWFYVVLKINQKSWLLRKLMKKSAQNRKEKKKEWTLETENFGSFKTRWKSSCSCKAIKCEWINYKIKSCQWRKNTEKFFNFGQ